MGQCTHLPLNVRVFTVKGRVRQSESRRREEELEEQSHGMS